MTTQINPVDRWIQLCSLHPYEGPVTKEMQTWISAFGVSIENRTESAALNSLSYIQTPSTRFQNVVSDELSKHFSNPLSSFLYLLSLTDLTPQEEHTVANLLLRDARFAFPASSLNVLLAGITAPSSKENAHLITLLFHKKIKAFFERGSHFLSLIPCDSHLPAVYQLLYFHLQYLQTTQKTVSRSFIENCLTALESVFVDDIGSRRSLNFSHFRESFSSHLFTTAGASHLIGQLLKECTHLMKKPSPTDVLDPLLKTLLSWPDCDTEITYPTVDKKWFTEALMQKMETTLFRHSPTEKIIKTLIEKMPTCFAIQAALLNQVLQEATNLSDILPLLEAVNTYEPLKEALKPTALAVSRKLQLFWSTLPQWQRGALTLYNEVVEKKNSAPPHESDDYQLFIGEIIAHAGALGPLRERYNLLFNIQSSDD